MWWPRSRDFCFVVCCAKIKVYTSAVPESTASHRPWPDLTLKYSRARLWTSSCPVKMQANPTPSKTEPRTPTELGCRAAPTAEEARRAKSASLAHGSKTSCSWSDRQRCLRWRNTARGCGAMTSWKGNTRACWRNIDRRRRAPGKLGARTPENVTGRHGTYVHGSSNEEKGGKGTEEGNKKRKLNYGARLMEPWKRNKIRL